MKRMALETIGCRLNQYETEKIAAQLAGYGFRRVDFQSEADLYVINTCTVTGRADASCRRAISRATRHDSGARVVVVGCLVNAEPEEVAALNGVDLVIENKDKDSIGAIIRQKFPDLTDGSVELERGAPISEFYAHHRAWVKIGDGCNQNCSFCVVPMVRGGVVNRAPEDIISEIESLIKAGYHEVVLTGVHIGQYRYEEIDSPAELLKMILKRTTVSRVRLSSIEPQEVGADLIEAMKEGKERVCRHLHIPLQSGADRILKLMHRPYSSQQYLEIIKRAKGSIEGLVVGADVIVGFPGETEDDFERSVEVVSSGLIDYLHVFSYSDRRGTEASRLSGKVSTKVIKTRNEMLRAISRENYHRALMREIGKTVFAISEHRPEKGDVFLGITDNYLKIALPSQFGGSKETVIMHATGIESDYLIGHTI